MPPSGPVVTVEVIVGGRAVLIMAMEALVMKDGHRCSMTYFVWMMKSPCSTPRMQAGMAKMTL